MKKIICLMGIVCASCVAWAVDVPTDAVLLQALNKTTGRTSFLTVKVGESYSYGDLIIRVAKCLKRPPEETPENSAFVDITEKEGSEVFRGWMFSSNPALSAMDHAVHDIWVVECRQKNAVAPKTAVTPLELDETDQIDIDELED